MTPVRTSVPVGTAASAMCFSAIPMAACYAVAARWVDVAVLMLAGLGQVIAFLWLRAPYARAVCSLILLTAGVSAAAQLYSRIWWWDILIHFLTLYALVWMAWNRAMSSPPRRRPHAHHRPARRFGWCAGVGLVIAVVWEVMELLGFLFVTPDIHIPPLDTLGDIVVGVLGAACVGFHRKPH